MRFTPRVLHSSVARAKSTAFIGLGRMGSEMAYNLFSKKLAQSPDSRLVVCDAVLESTVSFRHKISSRFPGASIDIVQTPEEAVRSSQTVITMLPSSPQVQSVYCNEGGIVSTLNALGADEAKKSLFIDSTTLDVNVARQVASDVLLTGAQMIDAPVSGGVIGAQAGTLSFLVGGPRESFIEAQPILELMGRRIIHCGPSGLGLSAKICNNLVLGVQQIVVGEAMLLGQKLGLDPEVLAGVINSSTGSCWASSANNPVPGSVPDKSPPCEKQYEGGFITALMLKDMNLARDVAKANSSALPLGEAARNLYEEVIQRRPDLAKRDFSSVYMHLRDL